MKEQIFNYILLLGDNSLILGQRLSELCGHGPVLEIDIALTNIALDLLGQTRSYFQYAAEIEGADQTEDDIAFLRKPHEYRNTLLVEQPNGDFAHTITRQYFFDAFHLLFLEALQGSNDETLVAIANKSIKEVRYHHRFSRDWVIRLGDGTEESNQRMQTAVDDLWMYIFELTKPTQLEKSVKELGLGVDLESLAPIHLQNIEATLTEAKLQRPESNWGQTGGKEGYHSEYFGFILSELQWMQKTYPKMQW